MAARQVIIEKLSRQKVLRFSQQKSNSIDLDQAKDLSARKRLYNTLDTDFRGQRKHGVNNTLSPINRTSLNQTSGYAVARYDEPRQPNNSPPHISVTATNLMPNPLLIKGPTE